MFYILCYLQKILNDIKKSLTLYKKTLFTAKTLCKTLYLITTSFNNFTNGNEIEKCSLICAVIYTFH